MVAAPGRLSRSTREVSLKQFWLALLFLGAVSSAAHARLPEPPPEIADIPVSMLLDLGSGQVLHAREAQRSFLPASLTKVMTAYVAFEEMKAGRLDPAQKFTVRSETARDWYRRGTSMFLSGQEHVSAHDLLRGIMTASANDAAVVLAEGYAGSVPAWTLMMNDAARRLGMKHSRFSTPNGWPDEGQTRVTAQDIARLASAMIRNFPDYYRAYSGKRQMVWKNVTLFSHDPVSGVVNGADGIKTGYTREAGYNFLGSAQHDGRRLVMVLGGAESEQRRANASRAYLEWGFSQWRTRHLIAATQKIGQARVQGGRVAQVALVARDPVYAVVPRDNSEAITLRIVYRGPVIAPIEKGQEIASLVIKVGDMEPGRVPLFASEAIESASPMDRLIHGFMNLFS
ncbi:MAG: D-alanyl-D-alanine carboxypeptidase [Sphingomonadaceae bacterium]|nr:D-alanyl-D-alanine carboxypeptidase [Sphingomonadaceae bacterium]